MPFPLIYIASWLSIVAGIYGLFSKAEDVIIEKSKIAISNWLKNLDFTSELPNVPAMFAETFDSIFTKKHFSEDCILRSCAASIISVSLISLIYILLSNFKVFELGISEIGAIYVISVYYFLFNLIADYFSLLETRAVVNLMRKSSSSISIIILLLFDLILTSLIFILFNPFTTIILSLCFRNLLPGDFIIRFIKEIYFEPLEILTFDNGLSIFFYSTFFTSVWLWLYAISGFIIKLISNTRKGLRFFQRHLDIDNKPLRSMAFVLITLITLTYLIIALFLLF